MRTIYIASPYTGQEQAGVDRQIFIASILIDHGIVPIVPLLSHYIHEQFPKDYDTWMKIDYRMILNSDAVYRWPEPSSGADKEQEFAKLYDIPVYDNLFEVIKKYGKL